MPISESYNEDCMVGMARYPDKFFDLAIVDPPYNVASKNKRGVGSRLDKTGKMNEWNSALPDSNYFSELFRVSKDQIIWGANNYEGLPRTEYFCIWNKKQTVENFASAEYAWISMGVGKPAKIFEYGIHKHNSEIDRIHPTQKPVQLYKWLLQNYALGGGKILDTHMGSQSSRIAAYEMGFNYTGFEIDPDYFIAGNKRFAEQTAQLPLFSDPDLYTTGGVEYD